MLRERVVESNSKINKMDLKKHIKDAQKLFLLKKALKWQEIKAIEQEYKRNLDQIKEINSRNSDLSFQVQDKLSWIQGEAERIDCLMYENKLGEFSE